jgi:uncharacterized protein
MRRLFVGYACMAVLFGCKAQPKAPDLPLNADNNTLLWQVSGKDLRRPTFIYGTFHLLCKDDIKISDALKQSLKYADTVYMELDMDDPSTLLGGFLFMNMKGGKKLTDFYTPEEYQRIADSIGPMIDMYPKMKPYMLMSLLYPKVVRCANPSGVEQELVLLAKENKKDIKGLETLEFQSSMFDSIPYEWQAKELLKAVDSFSMARAEFDSLVSIYKKQNLREMESQLHTSSFGMGKYDDLLLGKRNRNWVAQLKQLMPKQSLFVAVGAGHLVGEQGLISLLRKEGYTVQGIKN